MATWFTADLHLGHRNIIDYCDRPFTDVDVMNRALVDNWNEVVAEDDTVWIVGDFALGTIAETLPIVGELSGHKVLLAGNHDRCWAGHGRRAEGWTERYLEAGFAEVVTTRRESPLVTAPFSCATSLIEATAMITTGSSDTGRSTRGRGYYTGTSMNGGPNAVV